MTTENSSDEKEITVPPQLIQILKEYTKAVVAAKPDDLLLWSAIYFKNLASGQSPNMKERLYVFDPGAGGLSQAVLRLIYLKLKEKETVSVSDLKTLWEELRLDISLFFKLLDKLGISQDEETEVNWMKVLALATAVISKNLKDTLRKFLEITGGTTSELGMSLPIVEEIFHFLAKVENIPPSEVEDAVQCLKNVGGRAR